MKIVPRPPQEAPDYVVLQDELERSQNKIEELSAELARMTRKNEALQAEVDKLTRTKEMMSRSLQRLQRPDYKPLILESDRASAGAQGEQRQWPAKRPRPETPGLRVTSASSSSRPRSPPKPRPSVSKGAYVG